MALSVVLMNIMEVLIIVPVVIKYGTRQRFLNNDVDGYGIED